jgi:hypothetical protein
LDDVWTKTRSSQHRQIGEKERGSLVGFLVALRLPHNGAATCQNWSLLEHQTFAFLVASDAGSKELLEHCPLWSWNVAAIALPNSIDRNLLPRLLPGVRLETGSTMSSASSLDSGFFLPIRASPFILPAEGMNAADQDSSGFAVIAIGNAVIVRTTYTGFGTGRGHIGKSKLRSQNMTLALKALPASVVCLPKEIV